MDGHPGLNGRRTIEVRCLDRRGFMDYDESGIPVVFRWACRNQKCCPRRAGMVAVHRQTVYGTQNGKAIGEVHTTYEPTRPLSELIDLLPPERVRRVGFG